MDKRIAELTRVFKALGDETRLQMVGLLLHSGELCVCDFMGVLGTTQSKASRHLRYLFNAGLVSDRREAVWVHYRIREGLDVEAEGLVEYLRGVLSEERLAVLLGRLEEWRASKSTGVGCCG